MKTVVVGLSANGFVAEVQRRLEAVCRPGTLELSLPDASGALDPAAADCDCLILVDEVDSGERGAVCVVELDVPCPSACPVDNDTGKRWRDLVAALPSRPSRTYGLACRCAGEEARSSAETAAGLIECLVEEEKD